MYKEEEEEIGEDGFPTGEDLETEIPPDGIEGMEDDFGLEDPDDKYH